VNLSLPEGFFDRLDNIKQLQNMESGAIAAAMADIKAKAQDSAKTVIDARRIAFIAYVMYGMRVEQAVVLECKRGGGSFITQKSETGEDVLIISLNSTSWLSIADDFWTDNDGPIRNRGLLDNVTNMQLARYAYILCQRYPGLLVSGLTPELWRCWYKHILAALEDIPKFGTVMNRVPVNLPGMPRNEGNRFNVLINVRTLIKEELKLQKALNKKREARAMASFVPASEDESDEEEDVKPKKKNKKVDEEDDGDDMVIEVSSRLREMHMDK
jgi:hypothetical protein